MLRRSNWSLEIWALRERWWQTSIHSLGWGVEYYSNITGSLAKTWGMSSTEGQAWRGDIILGQPETDSKGMACSWSPERLSSPQLWPRSKGGTDGQGYLFVGYIFPEQIPNPSFQRKEKTDLLGQRLSLRNVLVAMCQPRIPPTAQTSSRQAGAVLNPFNKAGIRSHSLGDFQQSHVPSSSAPVFKPA